MSRKKPVIGLTGGIGAGKTLVAGQMAAMGAAVVDADALAKAMLDRPQVKRRLVEWWGRSILGPDGRVDRQAVSQIVFGDAQQRRRLEELIHPLVEAERDRLIARAQADASVKAVVLDAPLLLEAGWAGLCDRVVFVAADRSLRLARVQAERGWDEAELARREKNQWPLDKKLEIADDVVDNNAGLEACRAQVSALMARLVGPAESSPP